MNWLEVEATHRGYGTAGCCQALAAARFRGNVPVFEPFEPFPKEAGKCGCGWVIFLYSCHHGFYYYSDYFCVWLYSHCIGTPYKNK